MPATRSRIPNERHSPLGHDPSVIVLSDGDDLKATIPRRKRPTGSRKIPATAEVLEISSDEDDHYRPRPVPTGSQVKELQRVIAKISKDKELLTEEVEQLKQTSGKPGDTINISALEDSLCCEVCTMQLWSPFILTDCGHIFCQSCLQDWFTTALNHFRAANPQQHNGQIKAIPQHYIDQLSTVIGPIYRHQLMAFNQMAPPSPQYTCPSCRTPVVQKPTEVFAIKALVRTIAEAKGESSPKKANPGKPKVGRGPNTGHWATFFP